MLNRKAASYVALAVFLILLIAGINLIIAVGPSFHPPEKTTTVVEIGNGAGRGKKTKSFEKEGHSKKKPGTRSITVERPTGKPIGKKTTTVEEGSRSFVERVLGKSGLIALQVAIVVLAAFLGAALTQKALVGDFSLKVANVLEIAAVQDRAEDNAEALTAKVAKLQRTVTRRTEKQKALAAMVESNTVGVATTAHRLQEISQKVEEAERKIAILRGEDGNGQTPPTASGS